MRKAFLLTAVLGLLSSGCASSPAASEPKESSMDPIHVTGSGEADRARGKLVRFQGIARNAKLGAVVQGEGLVVYCKGMDSWPSDRVGKPVTVSGVLERTDAFKATVGPGGEIGQGTMGGDYVLESPKVE